MAEGTSVWSNGDRYVSRMNLRHEKHLQKQLAVLEHERNMKAKSMDADRRTFEDRVHRLNMDPSDRAHLSTDTNNMVPIDKRKELDRLLRSLMHRPYETRAGYSYIEYLSKNMQPLVKRPLQWGINPPLSPRKEALTQGESRKKSEPKREVFLTQIEGQTVSLSQRASIPHKTKARSKGVVLPPIVSTVKLVNRTVPEKSKLSPRRQTTNKEISKEERILDNKETSKLERQRKKSSQKGQKVDKQEKVQEKPSIPLKETQEEKLTKVFITMATLKVPSPTFPSIVDIPRPDEEDEEFEVDNEEVKVSSHSQSYYAFSMRARRTNRRNSI